MQLVTKTLTQPQLDIVNLLLTGALAPQEGFLTRQEVLSVHQQFRLKNGALAALPLALPLTPAEKHSAQISGRIALTDGNERLIAEVQVSELYKLPADSLDALRFFDPTVSAEHWFAAGTVTAIKPILYARFKQSRPSVKHLKIHFQQQRWNHIVALQAKPVLNEVEAQQACEWLFANHRGGLLIQTVVDESADSFHDEVHAVRNQIRCSAAKDVKLAILPAIQHLSAKQEALLHAIISRNSGVTALVIGADTPASVRQWLQRYRDELDLELIMVKSSRQRETLATPERAPLQRVA